MARRDPKIDYYQEKFGIYLPDAVVMAKDGWRSNPTMAADTMRMAHDAQPALVTTPSSGIVAYLTTIFDPELLRVLTAPNEATEILEERRKGTWTDQQIAFKVVEHTGYVSSYGDRNNDGRANVNVNFPWRQAYLYQIITEFGDLEEAREALAGINWAAEQREAAVDSLNKFQNYTYFRGVANLQNYGLQNDPNLYPVLAPALKAWGGVSWYNGTAIAATANEIYNDVQNLFSQLVIQATGQVTLKMTDELVLALSPKSEVALVTPNAFGLTPMAMLKASFPKLTVKTAMQYGASGPTNTQGIVGGELVQMIAKKVTRQDVAWAAFNEKLRAHRVVYDVSSVRQKLTQGSWGTVVRIPFGIAGMLGV